MPFVQFSLFPPPFPIFFSFFFLIINLNSFIKCLGPNSGTLQIWHENRLQNHRYCEPVSCPAQTLHTSHPPPQHHSLKGSFVPGSRGNARVGALKALCARLTDCDDHTFRSSGPTLSILIIIVSSALEGTAATWGTILGLNFLCCLSLRTRMAKVDKYLRSDDWYLQGAAGRAVTIRGGSQELSCQVKSGLHYRFWRTFSDIIGSQIKAIQPQINRRNLLNWCLFLPGSQQQNL